VFSVTDNKRDMADSEQLAAMPPPQRIGHLLRNGWITTTPFDELYGAHIRKNQESGETDAGLRHPADVVPFLFSISKQIKTGELSRFYADLIPNARQATPDLPEVAAKMMERGATRAHVSACLLQQYDCSPYAVLQKVVNMARAQSREGPALWDIPPYLLEWVQTALEQTYTPQAPAVDDLLARELRRGSPSPRARRALTLVRAVQVLTPLVRRNLSQLRVLLLSAAHPPYLAAHADPHPDANLERQAEHALLAAYTQLDHPRKGSIERLDDRLAFALLVHLTFCETPDGPWRYQNCLYLRRAVCWDFSFPAMAALAYATAAIHGVFAAPLYSTSFANRLLSYHEVLSKNETSATLYVAPGVLEALDPDSGTRGLFDRALVLYDCGFGEFRLRPEDSWRGLSPNFASGFAAVCRRKLLLDELQYYVRTAPTDDQILGVTQLGSPQKSDAAASSSGGEAAHDDDDGVEEAAAVWYYAVMPGVSTRVLTPEEYDAFYARETPIVYKFEDAAREILEEREAAAKRKRKRRRR